MGLTRKVRKNWVAGNKFLKKNDVENENLHCKKKCPTN